ncbi:MAG: DUF4625 domain-containing protein [Bacteroides sp.]|nr:DUF4625 domain-containing protein [Bacteroides sp.]
MKTIKINSSIVFLSFFSFFLCTVAACDSDNDGDTTRPVIRIIAPAEDAHLLIGDEEGVLFEAEFSDDIQLASYKIDIHYAGDGHMHTRHGDGEEELPEFSYQRSFTLQGTREQVSHRNIVIPEGVRPGEYHLVVYCSDTSGNESLVARDIVLIEEEHDHDH